MLSLQDQGRANVGCAAEAAPALMRPPASPLISRAWRTAKALPVWAQVLADQTAGLESHGPLHCSRMATANAHL